MSTLEIWRQWYQAFERSASDDQWSRLADLMTPDVQYRIVGAPFSCVLKGREAIIDGFRRSFAGFDHRFDKRSHIVTRSRVVEPGHVEAHVWGLYEKAGLPPLAFPAIGHWHIDEGRIGLMVDFYDPGLNETLAALEWIGTHGPSLGGLDPRYRD